MTFIAERGFNFELLDVDINDYDDEYVESFIRKNRYDVILFGCIVTHYKWIKWLTQLIKRCHPSTKVIIGNSVGSSCPEVTMGNTPVDVIVRGEGEYSCAETLEAIAAGNDLLNVEGIVYRNDAGTVVTNSPRKACNINELPIVNWDYFDVERYFDRSRSLSSKDDSDKNIRTMPVSTARGCAFKCSFCHYVFWDDPYRFRQPDNVLLEIRRNIEKYGANYIEFWDDLSFASLPQAERMIDAILASGLKFKWSAAIRTDLFGKPKLPLERRLEVAKKMKRSGCGTVGFSLESGNKEILSMMNKHVEVEFFEEQIKVLREAEIISETSVVFGYPIETKETIAETFEMCLRNRVYPSIGFLLPLPATRMYQYAKENGFITDEDAYLTSITERQDICLNMTALSDSEVMDEIKTGARELNRLLELGLDESTYVKTGGYKKHTNAEKQLDRKRGLDPENVQRNENDFSFNYSEAIFDMPRGGENQEKT